MLGNPSAKTTLRHFMGEYGAPYPKLIFTNEGEN